MRQAVTREVGGVVCNTAQGLLYVWMQFVRGTESHDLQTAPLMQSFYPWQTFDFRTTDAIHQKLHRVCEHLVELTHTCVHDRVRELEKLKADMPDAVLERKRANVYRSLSQMVPGSKSETVALKLFDGSVTSDMNSVEHHLNVYWCSFSLLQ